jgi:hypothetical protein
LSLVGSDAFWRERAAPNAGGSDPAPNFVQQAAALTLPAEIQAALDVPWERLPDGLTQAEVKRIARIGGVEEQRAAFAAWWPKRAVRADPSRSA